MRNLVFLLLMAMVFQIPWEDIVYFGKFGTLIRAIGMVAAFLGFIAIFTTGRVRGLLPIHYLMILFVAFASLSIFWSISSEPSLQKQQTFLQVLVFVWLIWEFAPDAVRQRLLLHAYIWGGGFAIMIQFLGMKSYIASSGEEERFAAGEMNVNEFALTLLMSIPMAIYCASDPKLNRFMRLAYLLYCPVCAISILLTGSRMGFVAICIMTSILGLIYLFKRPVFTIGLSLLAGVIFLFLFPKIMPESTWERLSRTREEVQTGTWGGRMRLFDAGLAVFEKYPVLGVGLGNFPYAAATVIGSDKTDTAHNSYLSVIVELGAVGLLLFLSMIIIALIYTFKMPFRERYTWRIILITWSICAFAGSLETRKLLWFILGLVACQFATFTNKGIAKMRAEPLGVLGAGGQLQIRPRWGNTKGT